MVIYLHGHVHKGHSRHEVVENNRFLTLQAGTCFLPAKDEPNINRMLWCNVDVIQHKLFIEPLQWSHSSNGWKVDEQMFADVYRQNDVWLLPLPQAIEQNKTSPQHRNPSFGIPSGWTLVDAHYLKQYDAGLSGKQVLSYFDGRSPSWHEALSPEIPRREIVWTLLDIVEEAKLSEAIGITLLTGAAGEGKTTALLQTACEIIRKNPHWHIIWREDPEATLPAEFLTALPKDRTWLVVSDDAELVAKRVYDVVQTMRQRNRHNIHFLLCCRDTDWQSVTINETQWQQYATFVHKRLSGLSEIDAQKVVASWKTYGVGGLKGLDGLETQDAVKKLIEAARSERYAHHDGTFFGAVLQVRWGNGLKDHIRHLLQKLDKRSIVGSGGYTLRDAIGYIAAMHTKDLQILTKEVLAAVLHIKLSDLKRLVLGPLGQEAAIATTGRLIFTRHRAIATVALELLSDVFNEEIEDYYIELTQAAINRFLKGDDIIDITKWNYLSSDIFEKGDHILGIRIAQSVVEIEPDSPYLLVNLAKLYRKNGNPEQSIRVFRSAHDSVKRDRNYYYEWSISESLVGRQSLSICLAAFSISDECVRQFPSKRDARIILTGLCITFSEMCNQSNLKKFIEASSAIAQLVLHFGEDTTLTTNINHLYKRAKTMGIIDVEFSTALNLLKDGVVLAWEQREDDLPNWVTPGNELTFNALARLLGID